MFAFGEKDRWLQFLPINLLHLVCAYPPHMGSDDGGKKTSCGSLFLKRHQLLKRNQRVLVLAAVAIVTFLGVVVVLWCLVRVLPPPELVQMHTFRRREEDYSGSTLLPEHCAATARTLDQCQTTAQDTVTVVFCCHRKWCQSHGHCEPCSGIGDRMRFLLAQVELASCSVGRIQIDSPVSGLQVLESAVYTDPVGWWGELLHYRSYSVSDRKLLPYREMKRNIQTHKTTGNRSGHNNNYYYYTHFTPDEPDMDAEKYNACYFHAIFRPDPQLQADLDRNNAAIGIDLSIGIHYRTGDAAAFGIANADNRVEGSTAMDGWDKMYQCAVRLAKQLFPDKPLQDITFYLASDNRLVKDNVRERQLHSDGAKIYLTDVEPGSFLRGNSGDREAWMELYLLAARKGLVANLLPKGYKGNADRLSQFALLARKIGFLHDHQFMECSVD
jgi:hypothetical protein